MVFSNLLTTMCFAGVVGSVKGFSTLPRFQPPVMAFYPSSRPMANGDDGIVIVFHDDDDEEDDEEEQDEEEEAEEQDPYKEKAASEFADDHEDSAGSIVSSTSSTKVGTSNLDWGGEYGKLSERIADQESGESLSPSKALFRVMTIESANQAIGSFLQGANPQVVSAMSGAISSMLGGLSTPTSGMETIVRTTGDKIGNLCFQLQMTGYMFRNAEYLVALKDIMKIKGGATVEDYRAAFDRLDQDKSGFIDSKEIEALLSDVYDGKVPAFEIDSFIKFFDVNNDGRISWQEFERGLGVMSERDAASRLGQKRQQEFLLPAIDDEDDEIDLEATVSGTVEIEMADGKIVEVEAKDYIESLKNEAEALKAALRQETGQGLPPGGGSIMAGQPDEQMSEGIMGYISSRKGDIKTLTESIQPEIVETMRMLVDFVLEGGENRKNKSVPKEELEMEIPGSALQQLALWQLVLGYKLREAEATGDYLKLLE